MDRQHLFKYSKSYALLKKYVGFAHAIFYSEICVINAEVLPKKEPVIFAPNHQNALMDALAILLTIDKQPVFMARADIFKKETISKILYFLKIIPVYRIRDGIDNMSNNDESFDIALRALGYGQAVGIMPEGNHGDQHRLRPLKKGVARFALKAQENFGDTVPVKIVPVGLEFSHYSNFRSKLLVIYGEPINVMDYWQMFKENPQNGYTSLRNRLASELKKYMLNIDTPDYYLLIFEIKEIYAKRYQQKLGLERDYYSQFIAEKAVTDKLVKLSDEKPAVLDSLKAQVNEYTTGLKGLSLQDWVLDEQMPDKKALFLEIAKFLFFLPFFLVTTVFNFIPVFICSNISERIKDTQFRSSFKFVLGTILFPVYYLLFLLLPIPLMTKLILVVPMPVLGALSYDYYVALKKSWVKYRYFKMIKEGNHELATIRQTRTGIFRTLDHLFL
jgi:1-acyl-sn-glycerol-3-phosphate acyltransferase